ncbi:hypothetical protein [Segetibacter sp.]|uniref:hypothetical protein n=1 Tax=Segetibacter sp. TaxID=2231182 RepID=UPI002623E1FF|nr:hypothetical protein [Segetibacter sp.]MCW3079459.1 hypothetical protein [Segetibacter sp.]
MLNNYKFVDRPHGKKILKQKAYTIEFVGPPGAGKTTSCKCLSGLLESNGYTVCTWQDMKDYIRKMAFIEKCILVLKLVLCRGQSLILYMISLANNRIYSTNSIYRYIRLTLFDLALEQIKKNGKIDVVLLDQWTIQEMWSATIFRAKSYSSISKSLSRFYFRTDVIYYFDIDVNTAAERIEMRPTKTSRFDRMAPEKRIQELEKYTSYLFQLFESSECVQKYLFSGNNSPERNAALVAEHCKMNYQFN